MRIGFNARFLASPNQRGFNRYTAELVRALAAAGTDCVLFSDEPVHGVHGLDVDRVRVVTERVKPQLRWQHGWLPAALAKEHIDVFHAPAHWGVPWRSPCPVVATIHDLADRELPSAFKGSKLGARLRFRLEEWLVTSRAARIITVSEYSAGSITRFLGVPRDKITVTVEGAAPAFDAPPPPDRARGIADRRGLFAPFFISVGGFDRRKNLELIVRALVSLEPRDRLKVALVGSTGPDADALRGLAQAAGVERWLPQLGSIEDEELAALYSQAAAVVMPSRLEGFGLPVVEAMHVGTPSIVSSAASLPEIAGDAGIVVGPDDAEALAAALRNLATDTEARDALAARARERAKQFTWQAAAQQTMAVYEAVRTKR